MRRPHRIRCDTRAVHHTGQPAPLPTLPKITDLLAQDQHTEEHTTMTTTTPESRARIAYTAYGKVTGFKNFQGNPMPTFDELPERIKEAWIAAAGAIWDLATTGRAEI